MLRRGRFFASAIAVSIGATAAHVPPARACELHLNGATFSSPSLGLPPAAPPGAFASSGLSLDVPVYHSLPNAPKTLYLDFDGDFAPNWGTYHPGHTPAYSIDSDVNSFSPQELSNIHQIWRRVSEKFSPFSIDVTTVDPGNRNDYETLQVVIGGDGRNGAATYWTDGVAAGGVAYIASFGIGGPNTVFVFPGNLQNGDPKRVSEASAHESGHAFGMNHQMVFDENGNFLHEYNPGDALRAPIMGRSYDAQRGLWWYGQSMLPTTFQDDIGNLANPNGGIGFRPDDRANTSAGATLMAQNGTTVSGSGVIEFMFDTDYFTFTTLTGEVSFTLDVAPFGPMLDASLLLYDAAGQLLASANTPSLGESLNVSLSAGSYFLAVKSAGVYGDIGQYFLTGTVVAVPEPSLTMMLVGGLLALRRSRRV